MTLPAGSVPLIVISLIPMPSAMLRLNVPSPAALPVIDEPLDPLWAMMVERPWVLPTISAASPFTTAPSRGDAMVILAGAWSST